MQPSAPLSSPLPRRYPHGRYPHGRYRGRRALSRATALSRAALSRAALTRAALTPAALLLLALVVPALAGCGGGEEAPEQPLRPVRYSPVEPTDGPRVRKFTGAAKAGTESRLSFRVQGTVERLPVAVGDQVRAGQLIAEIDDADFQLQEEQARAALAQAEAQRRNAEASYERVRALYENNNASLSDLDTSRASFESAEASVDAAAKQLELARSQIRYTRLSAPVAGAIAEVAVEVNENVSAGQQVVILASGARPEVEVAMPESLIAGVTEGDLVEVTFDALPDRTFEGEVTEVGVAITGRSTTFPVTVRLAEGMTDGGVTEVRSGMAAEVAFLFGVGSGESRIVVPTVTVGEDREGRFVFVVQRDGEETGRVARRPVEVGELTGEGVEIRSGLVAGELLVTAGVSRLVDGQPVRLIGEHGGAS